MKKIISNAFSLQMLTLEEITNVSIVPVEPNDIPWTDCVSAIGHADTAAVVSDIAGITVPCNRISVHLDPGDILYVAQVVGGRLPEGSTTLPEGFKLKFYKATITEGGC